MFELILKLIIMLPSFAIAVGSLGVGAAILHLVQK